MLAICWEKATSGEIASQDTEISSEKISASEIRADNEMCSGSEMVFLVNTGSR